MILRFLQVNEKKNANSALTVGLIDEQVMYFVPIKAHVRRSEAVELHNWATWEAKESTYRTLVKRLATSRPICKSILSDTQK